jgi:hypothetical protein
VEEIEVHTQRNDLTGTLTISGPLSEHVCHGAAERDPAGGSGEAGSFQPAERWRILLGDVLKSSIDDGRVFLLPNSNLAASNDIGFFPAVNNVPRMREKGAKLPPVKKNMDLPSQVSVHWDDPDRLICLNCESDWAEVAASMEVGRGDGGHIPGTGANLCQFMSQAAVQRYRIGMPDSQEPSRCDHG